MWVWARERRCLQSAEEGFRFTGAAVVGICAPPDVGERVFRKSSKSSMDLPAEPFLYHLEWLVKIA